MHTFLKTKISPPDEGQYMAAGGSASLCLSPDHGREGEYTIQNQLFVTLSDPLSNWDLAFG